VCGALCLPLDRSFDTHPLLLGSNGHQFAARANFGGGARGVCFLPGWAMRALGVCDAEEVRVMSPPRASPLRTHACSDNPSFLPHNPSPPLPFLFFRSVPRWRR